MCGLAYYLYTEVWDKGPKPPLGWPFHNLLTLDIIDYAYTHKEQEEYDALLVTPMSQAANLLNKRRTTKQIIDDMIEEAAQILEEGLPKNVALK